MIRRRQDDARARQVLAWRSVPGWFFVLALLSLLVACQGPARRAVLSTGEPLDLEDPRAHDILAKHRDRIRHGSALRGAARVALESPDGKLNRPQRIAVSRPGNLRFEVLGLFDTLAALLVSNGREFGFYDASSGEVTRGVATPDLLWRVTGLDLDPDEAVELLLAARVPHPRLALAGAWLEPDAGISLAFAPFTLDRDPTCVTHEGAEADQAIEEPCRASLDDLAQGGEYFRFDAHGLLREIRSFGRELEIRYRAHFDDYADDDPNRGMRPFPNRITIHSGGVDAVARFDWKRIMLSDELPDRLFTIPDGIGLDASAKSVE